MANEEPKALWIPYLILTNTESWYLQTAINKQIDKWYIPYWTLMFGNWVFAQCMIDPLVLERQQLTVREVSNIKKWAISSTVTIPGTVNVSWCECNCW